MNAAETIARDLDSLVAEVADRFTDEVKQGRAPSVEAYAQRHPEIATIIRQVFPALAILGDISAGATAGLPSSASVLHESDDPAHPASSTGVLGDFRILREIGRGGMGVVYEAEQISLGRRVALKVLPFAAMLDRQQLARFKNEARAAATLDHPNIVAIYSVGGERSVHFYAMQLIEGQSLAQVIDQLRAGSNEQGVANERETESSHLDCSPPLHGEGLGEGCRDTAPIAALSTLPAFDTRDYFRAVAKLGIQAAEALDHAHQNGILHRDIKPANLLVECSHHAPRDETSNGPHGRKNHHAERDDYTLKLWITDFGLARIEQDAGMTMTGDILGTLRYMSPEQALAKRVVVDHRGDIYSLGVTLYELLTLQPVFPGNDRQELLRQIACDEPRKLRQISPRIPQDLQTIVEKAIEKDPTDRYATALELRNDLIAFLEHRSVVARSPSSIHSTRKWLRRHRPMVVASGVTLMVAIAVGMVGLLFAFHRERQQRQAAQQSLELARDSVDEMLTKVASTWVADSASGSEIQRQFLDRALGIYQRLAKQPLDGNLRGIDSATAFERMADIHMQLGEFRKAIAELQITVEMYQELAAVDDAASSAPLVRSYRKLAHALATESQVDASRQATDRGVELAQQLLDQKRHLPHLERELARLLYLRATALMDNGKVAEAATVISQPAAQLVDRLGLTEHDPLEDLVLAAELASVRSTILLQQGQLDDAAKAASSAVSLRYLSLPNYSDAKPLLDANARLFENLADIRLAHDQPAEAVEALRSALCLRKQRLGGRTPTQINLAIFTNEPWLHGETRAVANYCGTQLRLARALALEDRPYEAEAMLGEALEAAQILNDTFPDVLEFWVLDANAAAAVGEQLTERNSPEASYFLRLAAALWSEMRLQSPQAEQFQSEAHGVMRDWDWFRSAHPEHAKRSGTRESLKLNNFTTAFWHRMLGLAWFERATWDAAAAEFEKSADMRKEGQAYDWLHFAMSCHHRGQADQAKSNYQQAVAQMNLADTPDAELESLRRTVEHLLAVANLTSASK